MIKFLASNGIYIVAEDDHLKVTATDDRVRYLLRDSTIALREFFLAERDADLGRWRSSEHPGIYVVPFDHDPNLVQVVKEEGGTAYAQFSRNMALQSSSFDPMIQSAREWFETRPEPKPWHDAKPGEVWLLEVLGLEDEFLRVQYQGERWLNTHTGLVVPEAEDATAGRRIWPEGANENS